MDSPHMRPKIAAKYLGTTPETLEYWRRERRGPYFTRVGRFISYHRDDLDR